MNNRMSRIALETSVIMGEIGAEYCGRDKVFTSIEAGVFNIYIPKVFRLGIRGSKRPSLSKASPRLIASMPQHRQAMSQMIVRCALATPMIQVWSSLLPN